MGLDLRNKSYREFLALSTEFSMLIARMDAKNEEIRKTNAKVAEYNDKNIDIMVRFYNSVQDVIAENEHNNILMKLHNELNRTSITVPEPLNIKEELNFLIKSLKSNGENKQT